MTRAEIARFAEAERRLAAIEEGQREQLYLLARVVGLFEGALAPPASQPAARILHLVRQE